MDLSRRLNRHRNSFTLQITSEPLFHDEEISSSGIHIENPLWDSASSFSFQDEEEDQLVLPSSYLNVARRVLSQSQSTKTPTKSSTRRCLEVLMMIMGVIMLLCLFAGLVILSLFQKNAVWASPGLLVDQDDDVLVDRGILSSKLLSCPNAWTDSWEQGVPFSNHIESMVNNRTLSLCEMEFSDDCRCSSTLAPTIPNVDFPDDETIAVVKKDLDVVILGDTLVESCAGGLDAVASKDDTSTDRNGMAALCHRLFRKENGGQINGIALGASDDRAGNLLYRLQNDNTILENLDPKVWWIVIGSNDIAEDHCSAESIAWAVMPLIQVIKSVHPNAKVVVNSIISSHDDNNHGTSVERANHLLACFAERSSAYQFFDWDPIPSLSGMTLHEMTEWVDAIVHKVLELTT